MLLVIGFILMALSFAFAGKRIQAERIPDESNCSPIAWWKWVKMSGVLFRQQSDAVGVFGTTFFSVHQCVEVYADGEQIYSLEKSSTVFGRTPGTGWNTIQLQEGVKSFSVRIEAVYPAVQDHVTRFYQE